MSFFKNLTDQFDDLSVGSRKDEREGMFSKLLFSKTRSGVTVLYTTTIM
jgi:hypothetical protein